MGVPCIKGCAVFIEVDWVLVLPPGAKGQRRRVWGRRYKAKDRIPFEPKLVLGYRRIYIHDFFGRGQLVAMSSDVYRYIYLTCMVETKTRRPFETGLWWGHSNHHHPICVLDEVRGAGRTSLCSVTKIWYLSRDACQYIEIRCDASIPIILWVI